MRKVFALIILFLVINQVKAQFFTINSDFPTSKVANDAELQVDSTEAAIYDWMNHLKAQSNIVSDTIIKSQENRGITSQSQMTPTVLPLNVRVIKSTLELALEKRMTVCMPLDFMKINSSYGFRSDPITHCSRFHDGIDLHCRYEKVYAMLPGKVERVCYGNNGYGNHIVLQHGNLECLYGHLSSIAVREGDTIQAGDVVAVSGNSGRTTGPHLHLRLKKDGKSVDPSLFIRFLNDYIRDLQQCIAASRSHQQSILAK